MSRSSFEVSLPGARSLESRELVKLASVLLPTLLFIASYRLLFQSLGYSASIFSTIPVLVAAWLYGARLGLLIGVATFPVNAILVVAVANAQYSELVSSGGPIGSAAEALVGYVVGQIAELRRQALARAAEVEVARDALRELTRELDEVREEERRTIAQRLHDDFGQELAGVSLMLQSMSRSSTQRDEAVLEQAASTLNALMDAMRQTALELRPSLLDDLGLLPTLEWLANNHGSNGLTVEFTHAGVDARLDSRVETAVYRVVQEALKNVALHAKTNRAWLTLSLREEHLYIEIEDRGVGFDADSARSEPSLGLTGMKERVARLDGALRVTSTQGSGTSVKGGVKTYQRGGAKLYH